MKAKKLLSSILVLAMILSAMGTIAFADSTDVIVLDAGTYTWESRFAGKTVKAADGAEVIFDMSTVSMPGLGGADVTFEGITFNWNNVSYNGLQHSGDLTYNNCVINGQVYLFGTSETFNGCTFNQNVDGLYNVWTYSAKEVTFNNCVFNSLGRCVLVYADGGDGGSVDVKNTTFNASTAVDGKAAIEIDTSNMTGNATVTVDDATTAVGFGEGSKSGDTLWNVKTEPKKNESSVVVSVADETVYAKIVDNAGTAADIVAKINGTYYPSIDSAIAAAANGDTIDLLGNTVEITSVETTKHGHAKNLTFQNGTFDYTNAVAGNSLYDLTANQSVTFKNMTLLIKDRAEGSKMCYWMDLRAETAAAYFINCKIDFDAIQYSYISANGYGNAYFEDCTIEAEEANFVYMGGATFENCTFDGYAGLSEGEAAANILNHVARPCVIKNSTVKTRRLVTNKGTVTITDGSYVYATTVADWDSAAVGLVTVDATSTLEAVEINMGIINDASEGKVTSEASSIYVQYKKTDLDANGDDNLEGADTYELVLVGANNAATEEIINELASADLTFEFVGTPVTGGAMDYTVAPAEGVTLTQLGDRFMFNYDGATKYEESGSAIVIGTIRIDGYGTYTFGTKNVETNAVYATEIRDNIVDGYSPAAGLVTDRDFKADDGMVEKIAGAVIDVPKRTLTINIAFPNEVKKQAAVYQDMKVEITGNIDGVNKTETYDLGEDMTADGKYVVTEDRLVLNNAYTVTVSGAGYRTARYTVTMTSNKELNFWNNVMDEAKEVEVGKDSSKTTKNFLAGDIVKDNQINIYDLSAVVSYFASTSDVANGYAKYDLNRDGVIDSKDVAYVLVSWKN